MKKNITLNVVVLQDLNRFFTSSFLPSAKLSVTNIDKKLEDFFVIFV